MNPNDYLLWQMTNRNAMGLKGNIALALEVYARKRGEDANLVEINAEDLGDQVFETDGISINTSIMVQKGTLFVGRKNQ